MKTKLVIVEKYDFSEEMLNSLQEGLRSFGIYCVIAEEVDDAYKLIISEELLDEQGLTEALQNHE